MKPIAIFDIDNTLVNGFTEELFIRYVVRKGYLPKTIFFRLFLWFLAYKIGFNVNIVNIRNDCFLLFKGKAVSDLKPLFEDYFNSEIKPRIFCEAVAIINKHITDGREVIMVSASLEPIVAEISCFLGIKNFVATKLEVVDGVYTGKMFGNPIYGANKVDAVKMIVNNASDLTLRGSYAYSDHISDLLLLESVDNAVVVNPERKFSKVAVQNGWTVINFNKLKS